MFHPHYHIPHHSHRGMSCYNCIRTSLSDKVFHNCKKNTTKIKEDIISFLFFSRATVDKNRAFLVRNQFVNGFRQRISKFFIKKYGLEVVV